MAQWLTGMGRIVIPYTVGGLTHKMRAYCRNPQVSGATFNVNSRTTDANDIDWKDAAQRFGNPVFSNVGASTISIGTAQLERFDGTIWELKDTTTLTISPTGSAFTPAAQITMVFRDTGLKKTKLVVLDVTKSVLTHFIGPLDGDADYDAMLAPFCAGAGNAADPFNWMVSHRNLYLKVAPLVGVTMSFNRKVRRRRGLT